MATYIPKTLDAIVTAIHTHAIPSRVERFQGALAEAWAAAVEQASLEPLTQLVRNWWTEAAGWDHDPAGSRRTYEALDRLDDALGRVDPQTLTGEKVAAMWEAAQNPGAADKPGDAPAN